MKNLRVTWRHGSPNDPTLKQADVPARVEIVAIGATVVFRAGGNGSAVYLAVPEARLISAIETTEATE